MAEGAQEQDRSEEASSFKLDKARKRGLVARGTDLGFVSALVGLAVASQLFGDDLVRALMSSVRRTFAAAIPQSIKARTAAEFAGGEAATTAWMLIGPALLILVLAVAVEIVQVRGLVFSAEPLKPDFNRLNPAQGLKRLFSLRMLKELGKNLLKMAIYMTASFLFIRNVLDAMRTGLSGGSELADKLIGSAGRLILMFIILAMFLAIVDQLLARREFAKQMRMSRRELTREVREREGEPRQKQKRKQILAEILKQASAAANVKGADVLITNPTHYAVALRYDPERDKAPVIQARGRNAYAARMRAIANREGIRIIRNPRLARALYSEGALGQQIGGNHFVAVADIYIMLRKALQEQGPR